MKHSAITLLKKVLVYCAGLFIMAMGVSFSGTADLGMSPVNSIPYVLSEIFTFLSMGTWIIVIFSLYILIQFLILGRDLQPARVLQLICTTLFGYFTDFTNFLADRFLPDPAGEAAAGKGAGGRVQGSDLYPGRGAGRRFLRGTERTGRIRRTSGKIENICMT